MGKAKDLYESTARYVWVFGFTREPVQSVRNQIRTALEAHQRVDLWIFTDPVLVSPTVRKIRETALIRQFMPPRNLIHYTRRGV